MFIIVPITLRHKISSRYHAGFSGGRMGKFKTLYRIPLRLYWHKLREDIKQWVNNYTHCVVYNVWRNRRQELHFS